MDRLWTALALLLMVAGLSLPAFSLETIPPVGAGGPTDLRSFVRVAHLVPQAPTVDVYLDTTRVVVGLQPGVASGYQAIMGARNYRLALRPAGATLTTSPIYEAAVSLDPRFYSTVAIVGAPDALQIIHLADDTNLPRRGETHVRFFNALRNAPVLMVSEADGTPLFAECPFGVTEYRRAMRLNGPFVVTAMGNTTAIAQIPIPPEDVRVYTIIVYGDYQAVQPLTLILVERVQ
jgi:hypothetical protein